MIKNKFFKNLYQSLCFFASVLVIICLILFVHSLEFGINTAWILLCGAAALIILFFVIGFYWIFQTVIIDEKGIKIVLINKTIRECAWNEIESIERTNYMRNPALEIKLLNDSKIHLDDRKSIRKSIAIYSKDIIL